METASDFICEGKGFGEAMKKVGLLSIYAFTQYFEIFQPS